jgi:type 1 glutamine amidotransferase
MEQIQKALLLGNVSNPKYHPLQEVMGELKAIFEPDIQLEMTEDHDRLRTEQIKTFDLCISYSDVWRVKNKKQQVAGLLSFVSGGGGLLAIHNGISLQSNYEISQMIGARFTGHPDYGLLPFHVTSSSHEITQGMKSFAMEEEPYRFDFDPLGETTVLLEYEHEQSRWPAAWAHEFGLGRIVYLMPGHHRASFQNEMYRKLILQSGRWACRNDS